MISWIGGKSQTAIDIDFIQLYIKKMYNKKIDEYFDISKPVLSIWRKKGMPTKRLSEFIVREESFDIYELFDRIYPKSNR